jgi:hypothetical protein
VATLASQIRQNPVILPELNVFNLDAYDLDPAQATADHIARIARFRTSRTSTPIGAERSALPCSAESQFPILTPSLFPFTLQMPAPMSGLRSPQFAAS